MAIFSSTINTLTFLLGFSPQNNPSTSYFTLPSGDLTSPTQSPTGSLPELPPIDYEDRLRNTPLIPAQMNGLDHGKPTLINAAAFSSLSASFWTFVFGSTPAAYFTIRPSGMFLHIHGTVGWVCTAGFRLQRHTHRGQSCCPETSEVSQSCTGMSAMTEGSVHFSDCVYEESAAVTDTSSTMTCEITQLCF